MRLRRLSDGGVAWSPVPASATASGTAGDVAYDGHFLYVATGASQWRRSPLATWTAASAVPSGGTTSPVVRFHASDAIVQSGNVVAWPDVTRNFVASPTGSPFYAAAGLGGSAAVMFDGASYLSSPLGLTFTKSSSATLIVVARATATTQNGLASRFAYVGSTAFENIAVGGFLREYSATPRFGAEIGKLGAANYLVSATSQSLTTDPKVFAIVYSSNVLSLHLNDVSIGTRDVSAESFSTSTSASSLWLGSEPGGDWPAQCAISEVVYYDSALGSTERSAISTALMAKYGIS